MTITEAIADMQKTSYDQYPVKVGDKVEGVVTSSHLLTRLSMKKVTGTDTISKVMIRDFRNMSSTMPISELSRVLEKQNFVLVDGGKQVASSYDVLKFMADK